MENNNTNHEINSSQDEETSLLSLDDYFGIAFNFNLPVPLGVRGYFKGFLKVDNYKYHIAEFILAYTDKGPLTSFFKDIPKDKEYLSFYIPFTKKISKISDLVETFNKTIDEWEEMKKVIDSIDIEIFDSKRELVGWVFDMSDSSDKAIPEIEISRGK